MIDRKALGTGILLVLLGCGEPAGSGLLKATIGDSPQRGPKDAWVTVVEFADFQCPFCRSEEPVLLNLAAAYPDDLRLVFKQFPLTVIHPYARSAAIAVECAGLQDEPGRDDRFWQMHDLVMQSALDGANLARDASQVPGLDMTAWGVCLGAAAPVQRIEADLALGAALEISGTPTFIINGEKVVGAEPESYLRGVIDRALAKAKASGIPREEYYDRAVLNATP